jgi:signal transduction histidine kinase
VTRRILVMLLAFTALVLVGAVVPLTLNATSHDRSSFIQAAAGTARTDAVVAQARLDQLSGSSGKNSALATAQAGFGVLQMTKEARQAGDGLLVLTNQGQRVAGSGMPAGNWDEFSMQANDEAQLPLGTGQPVQPITEVIGSEVIAAMPIYSQAKTKEPWIGTVLLARSTKPLEHEILELWVILGSIAVAAMIAAAVLGFAVARWVSRPLKALDTAARKLADGDLAIRAKVASGPPELRRLGTTFNTMAGRLEALVHGSRAMIADVSHQLRTPLAALRLRLDLLAADTDPETGHELAGALDELARLSRLVDGLLTVARAEGVVPVPTAVDVSEVARERVVAWHPVADDRGIILTAAQASGGFGGRGSARAPGAPVLAWIGEGHLEQVLDNLIANALDALSPGHVVRLTTEATATGARITVRDNGPGMSAEDRERAFLRFTTSSPNGTGLGLAIVHRLAVSNGGTARLHETPGGGLTVTLDFPGVPKAVGNGSAGPGAGATTATAATAASM